jgi:hypothetical protein
MIFLGVNHLLEHNSSIQVQNINFISRIISEGWKMSILINLIIFKYKNVIKISNKKEVTFKGSSKKNRNLLNYPLK